MLDAIPTLAFKEDRRSDNTCNAVALLVACSTSNMCPAQTNIQKIAHGYMQRQERLISTPSQADLARFSLRKRGLKRKLCTLPWARKLMKSARAGKAESTANVHLIIAAKGSC